MTLVMTPAGISAQLSSPLFASWTDMHPGAIITQLHVAKQTLHFVTINLICD